MEKTTTRNTTFEILRLLAMFMIVLEHCLLASALHTENPLSAIDNVGWFIEAFTICAVNMFFLLTGYYQKCGNFKLSRFVKIWLRTIFYSLVIYLIAVAIGVDSLSAGTLVSFICPVFFKRYWFMQTYIVLALLAPYIVALLDKLSEYRQLLLIGILLVFFSLHQTFIPVARTLDTTQGYGIIWGGILLVVGSFLRKYGNKYIDKIKTWIFLLGYAVVACGMFVSNLLVVKYDIAQGVTSRGNFYAYNSISVFIESICLFCFFIKLSKKGYSNRMINWFSASALSVYLISAHPELLYSLWTTILKMDRYIANPAIYIVVAIGAAISTILICILIDKLLIFTCKSIHCDERLTKLDSIRLNQIMNGK